jgi:hypothetical protein
MKKFKEIIIGIFAIILFPILLVIAAIARLLFRKPRHRTREEVAEIIDQFLNGTGSDTDWDDFICVPIDDSELDEIRKRCLTLDEEFPPTKKYTYCNDQGAEILKEYVKQLGGGLTRRSS